MKIPIVEKDLTVQTHEAKKPEFKQGKQKGELVG